MERSEYLYSGSTWFKEHLQGPEGHLWRRARKMFLFKQNMSSALNLFKFDPRAIKTISQPEGSVLIISKKTTLDPDDVGELRAGQSWTDDAKNSVRTLLDRIVTRWIPKYMKQRRINIDKLHRSLSPEPLRFTQAIYDQTSDAVDRFDVNAALALYQACLVPLHYHELWSEIVHDFKNVETSLEERKTAIDVQEVYNRITLDEEEESALIFGTNRVTCVDNYNVLSKKLGLFDIVLITIQNIQYFGMIVHVEQVKVKVATEDTNNQHRTTEDNHQNLRFDIQTTVGVYVSRACSDVIKQQRKQTNVYKLEIYKIGNITSSRRMISAINNLQAWPEHRSLLKPTIKDPYFSKPEGYDPLHISPSNGFNTAQSKTIVIAEGMSNDLQSRMHIVHGPPGTGKSRTIAGIVLKLLARLQKEGIKKKILLCAPSNNACDELCRRILDEFHKQDVTYQRGTLVRIGCQPPDDHRLCDYFLDFMVLQNIVNVLKNEQRVEDTFAQETETSIIRHAKIVVSTLNYCGSNRMHKLKNHTEFVIIDEASQSLEADFLLPLRFKCTKMILVGDPLQLPPCVLSDAGKDYGLSQSLYARLYNVFKSHPNGPITMLDTQYRMHPLICQFPSDYFYDHHLLTDKSVAESMKDFTLKPLYLYNMTGSVQTSDDAGSSENADEAGFIRKFCEMLIAHLAYQADSESDDVQSSEVDDEESDDGSSSDCSHSSDDESEHETTKTQQCLPPLPNNDPRSIKIQERIAVITPYRAQVRLLRQYLPNHIEVMTVDSSQGKEKDIVIISCVRSGSTIGFLDDMNRVNVMLTRSRNALYIVGNFTQLATQHAGWNGLLNHANIRKIISNVQIDGPYPQLPFR